MALAFSATAGLVFGATRLLVRALSAVIRSRLSFLFALSFPAGAAVWLGAGGEVGASEGMVAVVFPEWVLCRPWECSSGAKKSLTKAGGSVLLLVSRRPRNDPSGAWSVGGVRLGGLVSSPELSVGGEGAWAGLVASVGGWRVCRLCSISDGTLRCPRNSPSGPMETRWTGRSSPPLE